MVHHQSLRTTSSIRSVIVCDAKKQKVKLNFFKSLNFYENVFN